MAVMENEMTNIAVDYLHESPFHPWHKLRHRITGRPLAEVDRAGIAKLDREWMDEYDENIFRPLHQREAVEEAARKQLRLLEADSNAMPRDSAGLITEPYLDPV